MNKITLSRLAHMKQKGEKIASLTAYDASFAALFDQQAVDMLLVGDSLGMVLQGKGSTVPVTVEDIVYHTRAVAAAKPNALLMADMPFMSYATEAEGLANAAQLMRAGAEIVKLEGGAWMCDLVRKMVRGGIPVCAHLGLMPQQVNLLSGYKVQGRNDAQATSIIDEAVQLEHAGANMLLLECVPSSLAQSVSQQVSIPVIGIGAGAYCDGQILVMHDMLGVTSGKRPKFVKDFMADSNGSIASAVAAYVSQVKNLQFPTAEHSFK
ncbi:3-methyl-2-oxobutanoate hydroxymethyltransferase [Pelagibaculum spongiae]|uniref:3-methyl-2-oxobutanoate hydroxymethyltransferase n=1 Tax=Pelagibaculum spongiae TaxID=2080658 RepID=A0A2V1H526_9GAMM|nr:3-methyl-2-oxobutanoate hydroxymethyltransferase [Pelagibaculum spongiae]PVZ72307.1 3-methyl-2-oxobutanoate hydroxymethyltransferase [Pelagibaculum spongiae]